MIVDLRVLIDCLSDDRIQYWLDPSTGKVFDQPAEGFLKLPDHDEIDEYGNMREFMETRTHGTARQWLANAIQGAGAFRRFKATLERFHLLDEWYDFDDEAHRLLAIDWCERNGLLYEETEAFEEDDEEEYEEYEGTSYPPPVKSAKPEEVFVCGRLDIRQLGKIEYMMMNFADEAMLSVNAASRGDLAQAHQRAENYIAKKSVFLAMTDHSRVCSYLIMTPHEDRMILAEIFTRRPYRRKGLAGELLRQAENLAGKDGYGGLSVNVDPRNQTALGFFEDAGYQITSYRLKKRETG